MARRACEQAWVKHGRTDDERFGLRYGIRRASVTGVCLAEKGHMVVCVDIDVEKVNTINCGLPPVEEKSLKEMLQKNLNTRSAQPQTAAPSGTCVRYLSVADAGTPSHKSGNRYGALKQVSGQIGEALTRNQRIMWSR